MCKPTLGRAGRVTNGVLCDRRWIPALAWVGNWASRGGEEERKYGRLKGRVKVAPSQYETRRKRRTRWCYSAGGSNWYVQFYRHATWRDRDWGKGTWTTTTRHGERSVPRGSGTPRMEILSRYTLAEWEGLTRHLTFPNSHSPTRTSKACTEYCAILAYPAGTTPHEARG